MGFVFFPVGMGLLRVFLRKWVGCVLLKWKKHHYFCTEKLVVGDLLGECDGGGGGGGVSCGYALESMYHAE